MFGKREDDFDMQSLIRLGAWGGGAVIALLLAVVAVNSQTGSQRLALAFNPAAQGARGTQIATRALDPEIDARRLSETVRSLSADRDRLLARVTVLERNLEDVTGSIGREKARPSPAAAPLPPVTGPTFAATIAATPIPVPQSRPGSAPPATRVANAHATASGNVPPADSVATKTEFGIDLGGGANLDAMRELWNSARSNHAALLEHLRPLVIIRDGTKPGSVELRLIAGPLTNAAAAAKLCVSLAAGGWTCRPAVFDGQQLAAQ